MSRRPSVPAARHPLIRGVAVLSAFLVFVLGLLASSPGIHAAMHAAPVSSCGHGCDGHSRESDGPAPWEDHDCPVTHLASALPFAMVDVPVPVVGGVSGLVMPEPASPTLAQVVTHFARGPPAGNPEQR